MLNRTQSRATQVSFPTRDGKEKAILPLATGVQLQGEVKARTAHRVARNRLEELGASEEQLNGVDTHPGVIEALVVLGDIAASCEEGGALPSLCVSPECRDEVVSRLVIITMAREEESRKIYETRGELFETGTIRGENGAVFADGSFRRLTTATNGHVIGPVSVLFLMTRSEHSGVFDEWYQAWGHEISRKARS